MAEYQKAKRFLQQNVDLLTMPLEKVPINSVLCSLSKALLLLTESLEHDLTEIKETTAKLRRQLK